MNLIIVNKQNKNMLLHFVLEEFLVYNVVFIPFFDNISNI